jgi:homoserine kinase type II
VGLFTPLGDAELGELAAAFSLGAVRSFRAIAAGTINSNFAVETERGRFFIRVNEGKSEADVAWEARLVEALAAGGLPTPPPLHAAGDLPYARLPAGGAAKLVSVFPWRDGRHLAPAEVTAAHAGALGEALAALHEIGGALPAAWRRTSIYDHDHLVARYRSFASSDDPELLRAIAVIGEELALAEAAAPVRRAATSGIIHGDLFRDNVLWEGERLTAVLDFEQASGGSFAYDLAVCVNDWCWDPERRAPREELAGALLAGYQRRRPLPDADRAALPVELRAAAARFTITRITDVYLARVDNPDKDFRAFLARCEAWRGPALGRIIALL